MVRSSGSPAATRPPKAIKRMAIVTGHESISERIMADRFALLKLAHKALSPVRVMLTPDVESSLKGLARASAALTISFVPAAEPATMMAVRPSREIVVPDCGWTTVETRGSALSIADALATAALAAGSEPMAP